MKQTTILVVDDEKDLVRMIRYILEKEGYRVIAACDGKSGLTAIRRSKPDLVILDPRLPKMDGLDILRLLRRGSRARANLKESRLPVILLSGRRTAADRILGLKAGADDYVAKPFSPGELLARIEILLRCRAKANVKMRRLPAG
jgi:DNA-binding response OmpR family regulator